MVGYRCKNFHLFRSQSNMLSLLITREYILQELERRSHVPPAKAMIYSADNSLYAVERLQTTPLPRERSLLVFDCDLQHSECRQKIFIGLMETTSLGIAPHSPGIGVSVCLQTGLITDVVNNLGVIGYLENVERALSMHVRIEVEIIGRVYLPRIIMGEDIILHPALYLDATSELSALVGTSVLPRGDARFTNPQMSVRRETGAAVA